MKKTFLILTALVLSLTFTACNQQEPLPLKKAFLTAKDVNAMISELGEVNDVYSAAKVAQIVEEYRALTDVEQEKVDGIEDVFELIETATSFLNEEQMKIKVMSFNVQDGRVDKARQLAVVQTVLNEAPDIIGIQEGEIDGDDRITTRLRNLENYELLGTGREWGKKGEAVNVLYNTEKFILHETNTLWATDTPEVYSKHPDSLAYKIFTYQLLER